MLIALIKNARRVAKSKRQRNDQRKGQNLGVLFRRRPSLTSPSSSEFIASCSLSYKKSKTLENAIAKLYHGIPASIHFASTRNMRKKHFHASFHYPGFLNV